MGTLKVDTGLVCMRGAHRIPLRCGEAAGRSAASGSEEREATCPVTPPQEAMSQPQLHRTARGRPPAP
jgi:hypothetical protein